MTKSTSRWRIRSLVIMACLLTWLLQRGPVVTTMLPSNNEMCPSQASSFRPSLPRLIRPPPSHNNQTVVLCALAKDETPYLDEWIDYHLGIGFHHIYLYDNSEHGELQQWGLHRQQHLQDPVQVVGFPTSKKEQKQSIQAAAYTVCRNKVIQTNHTWVLCLDLDEFVVFRNRSSSTTNNERHLVDYPLYDFLETFVSKGAVGLHWRTFGTSGKRHYEPIPVTKRFQLRVPDDHSLNQHYIKTFHRVSDLDIHAPIVTPHHLPLLKTDKGGTKIKKLQRGPQFDEIAVIHHYTFKSITEYIHKRQRGGGFSGVTFVEEAKQGQTREGKDIPHGSIHDDTAWQILKTVAPRYHVYDDFFVR